MEDTVTRITFTAYGNIQAATADGQHTYEHQAGDTVELPADIAALFLASGVAAPAGAERATKAKGETATKNRKPRPAELKAEARDGDGDGQVQDGTTAERAK